VRGPGALRDRVTRVQGGRLLGLGLASHELPAVEGPIPRQVQHRIWLLPHRHDNIVFN
jgi:hypothetical protein